MLNKIFGSYSDREIKKIKKMYINKINNLENKISELTNDELKNKTTEFKNRIENGENIDNLIIESFAVVREASKRILGMRLYDVQLIGGIALHQGRITEMKTGEGKTLVATLPAYLNALTGKGVHIITVNDYLAKRDRNLLEPLYDFLGITSGYIISETQHSDRKEIYSRDIIYATNSEVGFDYLRDNMVLDKNKKVQRELNYCLIDEADSILIDEARTPLVISSVSNKPNHLYNIADIFVQSLTKEDFKKDEKSKSIMLTEKGVEKAERVFGIENYADINNSEIRHYVIQALTANYSKIKDIDYIIKDGKVVLIDEFTGRITRGRKLSNGLHQAIEAKEGVKITKESVTLASITYQSFFKEYNKISGMTGTAITEQQEFNETYSLDVVVIPTHKPILRKDNLDKLYMSEYAKNLAIIEDITENYKIGRPVLVGTSSIQKSEKLSELLSEKGIPHQVLNAKQHHLEAEIVSKAGNKNMITIATNMAGRGTDIKLGEGVAELGGLKVIGTERADNRRIDNQLIGRSGRQGDPGESQFYTSFEDEVIAFATEQFKQLISSGDKEDLRPVTNKVMDKIITKCQKNIEANHFQTRKELLKYDKVINKQRALIYDERNKVLETEDIREQVNHVVEEFVDKFVDKHLLNVTNTKDINLFLKETSSYIELTDELSSKLSIQKDMDLNDIKTYLIEEINSGINKRQCVSDEKFDEFLKQVLLYCIDVRWRLQIDRLGDLKKQANLLSYKQEDPLNTYISEAYTMFQELIYELQSDIIKTIIGN